MRLPVRRSNRRVDRLVKLPGWLLKWRYNRFIKFWNKNRGWEYERYSETFKGKKVLEIGGGLGYDGMVYSKVAAHYTYAEIDETQVAFLKRICALYGIQNVGFEWMKQIEHDFPATYNAFLAHGVLHHVPFETAKREFSNIDRYLEAGTRAVFLMYPKERWEYWGKPTFEKFGQYTDFGCPWAEYYDEEKILALTGNQYELVSTKKWGWREIEFVNFELIKK